jgi:cyclic-di-GMP phosphodiesterase TipF (flagellum assembly factor)
MAQKNKTAKKDAAKKRSQAALFGWYMFFTALSMIPALFSFELAFLAVGFTAVTFFVIFEMRERQFWEQAVSWRIKALADNQQQLGREVARSREDIVTLKEQQNTRSAEAAAAPPAEKPKMAAPAPATRRPLTKPSAKTPAAKPAIKKQPVARTTAPASPGREKALEILSRGFPVGARPELRAEKPAMAAKSSEARIVDHSHLSDAVVRELMLHAVAHGDISVFAQPVVRLPQRRARFLEMFARIRAQPGAYIAAGRYMAMATEEGLIHDIDQLLLARSLQAIEDTAGEENAFAYFINITSATLADRGFMNHLLGFLARNRKLAPRLVFEIRQKDFDDMQPAILEILRGLGRLGCALSLDHVEHFNFDLKFLQVLKVRFVKIDAQTLLKKAKNEKGATDIWRLKRKLEGNGIGFIVEKIESEYVLRELLDFDIHYGQGYLFGRPDLQAAYAAPRKAA